MRLFTFVGLLLSVLWPFQVTATVLSPDPAADWMQPLETDAFYKRGRDESHLQARGRAGPETGIDAQPGAWIPAARLPTQAIPKHQGKPIEGSATTIAQGKHGPRKALAWVEPERKGLSLVGQVQMVSAPRATAVSPGAQVGPLSFFAGASAIMIGITMIVGGCLASARDARAQTAFERGPYARAAQIPYVRR